MDVFTWLTIGIGSGLYFLFLWALKKLGKKIIALTWIPWRAIYLTIIWAINDDSKTRNESVQAAYGSIFYVVCFLISIHYTFPFFAKENNGYCATSLAWLISTVIFGAAFTLTWFALTTDDPNWALGIGSIGLILNALHLYFFHHPTQPHQLLDPKHITWLSIVFCTLTAFAVLLTIALLSDFGLHKLSGILYNFPLLAIVTVASLGCKDIKHKMHSLYDFIYILLHNVFIGNVFLGWYWYFTTLPSWSAVVNIMVSAGITLAIAAIMFLYVFRIGLKTNSRQDTQKSSSKQSTTLTTSMPYGRVRDLSSYRYRPQDTIVRF